MNVVLATTKVDAAFGIASVALILIGIETKGRVLEEITEAKPAVAY
jgi:hypothetical protein